MSTYSLEQKHFIKQHKRKKYTIIIWRFIIIFIFLFSWEILVRQNIINSFLFSSPTRIIHTMISLFQNGDLLKHIGITLYEVLISFLITTILSIGIATILWSNDMIAKIIDPYLTILNSLPKVALGPLIIIWVGASIHSIIFMALTISLFVTILSIYQGFISVNSSFLIMLKSFGANKWQVFYKVVLPSNFDTIISSLKINISMSLIGVIMGELLVSKSGIGYLIMYGSQVFQIDLVITGVFILGILSSLMYFSLILVEKYLLSKK